MSETMRKLQAFKRPGNVKVGNFRRVRHSVTNKLRAKTGRKDLAADTALNAAGMAGTGAALAGVIVPATIVAGAGAVLTGPIFAAAVGIVGILMLAKSAYSNRDKAHETLTRHVWSYIDDTPAVPPRDPKQVKAAALSLTTDGYAQQKLQSGKLGSRITNYNTWAAKYIELSMWHDLLLKNPNSVNKNQLKRLIIKTDKARVDHLDKGFNSGGAVYELVRRLIHRANYLQAYAICGKFFQGDDSPLADFRATVPEVAQWRAYFKRMAEKIDNHNRMSEECKT